MVALVADHGVEYLFAAVVLMGVLQVSAGALKLGKFIRMVPYPVMLGFVNGLAIVIFLAQLGQFGVAGEPGWLNDTFMQGSILDVSWIEGSQLHILLGTGGTDDGNYSFFTALYAGVAIVPSCNISGERTSFWPGPGNSSCW